MTPTPAAKAERALASTNRQLVALAVAALVILVVIGATLVTLQVAENRKANRDRGDIANVLNEVKDCTTPGGDNPCQRRMAASATTPNPLVEDIKRHAVAAAICGHRGGSEETIRACVDTLAPPRSPPSTAPPP